MYDRDLSALHVIAAALWVVAVSIVIIDLMGLVRLAPLGAVTAVAAMTLNVRGFLCHLEERTLLAYKLGRRVGTRDVSELSRR